MCRELNDARGDSSPGGWDAEMMSCINGTWTSCDEGINHEPGLNVYRARSVIGGRRRFAALRSRGVRRGSAIQVRQRQRRKVTNALIGAGLQLQRGNVRAQRGRQGLLRFGLGGGWIG